MHEASWIERLNLLILDHVDSTNTEAKKLANLNNTDEFVVWAREQYKGKGRFNRSWISEKGNLFFSLVLRPKKELFEIPQLSFLASLAIADALTLHVDDAAVSFKWPNDILLNEKKIAGILLESNISSAHEYPDWVCIGMGINVASSPSDSVIQFPATCLNNHINKELRLREILSDVIRVFSKYYDNWLLSDFLNLGISGFKKHLC